MTYSPKTTYKIVGNLYKKSDLKVYIGKIEKNKILSKNFVLQFEISNIKILDFTNVIYSYLFKNFLCLLKLEKMFDDLKFQIKTNWKVLNTISSEFELKKIFNEKMISLLLHKNFS